MLVSAPGAGAMTSATSDLFSPGWALELCRELNDSAEYRRAAAGWEGALGLEMTLPEGGSRLVCLDLWHGACRSTDVRAEDCAFLVRAPAAQWERLLAEGGQPLLALLSGRLELVQGDLARLAAWGGAAAALLAAARRVPHRASRMEG